MKEKEAASGAVQVFAQEHRVTREKRGRVLHGSFHGCTLWLTGLSGAGKTTIAFALEEYLVAKGLFCYDLDGDNVRHGISSNLDFSEEGRNENNRRVAEVSRLFADSGAISIVALISPFRRHREFPRQIHEANGLPFLEVFIDTPLEVCEQRDRKGLYKKARAGQLKGFTGIGQAYERPQNPDLVITTIDRSVYDGVQDILDLLASKGLVSQSVRCEARKWFEQRESGSRSGSCSPEESSSAEVNGEAKGDDIDIDIRELFVKPDSLQSVLDEVGQMQRLDITSVDLQWVQVLSEGWASPLKGFMRESEYLQTLHWGCQLSSEGGTSTNGQSGAKRRRTSPQPYAGLSNLTIPIVLAVSGADRDRLLGSDAVALWHEGEAKAVLRRPEFYAHRKEERCARTFGCVDRRHPVIEMIHSSGDWLVGGDLEVLRRVTWNDGLDEYRMTPAELRSKFADIGADAVFAFQLRNPVHNGHALLMTDCEKMLRDRGFRRPVLLLHPLGGWTKPDDVPLPVRMNQHKAILEDDVLKKDSTVLAIFPSPMSYAGPREVQWHARARMMVGVGFYIVGRDPAGIPHPADPQRDLYDPEHGAKVLAMAPGLSASMEIIKFKVAAYDTTSRSMVYFDPKRPGDFLKISGTEMRRLAKEGLQPPDGFMAPRAWSVLAEYYKNLSSDVVLND